MIAALWTPPTLQTPVWRVAFLEGDKTLGGGELAYVSPGLGELKNLIIVPSRRREGLGDGLVKTLLNKAESLGLAQVQVRCPGVLTAFFGPIGFTITGRSPETGLIEMRRELGIGFKCGSTHQ